MEKIEIFEGFWTEETVKQNPDKIFIFGDNDLRVGKGGQAIIRDLPNTFGIRTKKKPNLHPSSFYIDREIDENSNKIREDIIKISEFIEAGKTIVLSSGGYGTGLSKLPETAQKTFDYLSLLLKFNFNFDNQIGKKWLRIPSHFEVSNAFIINPIQITNCWFQSKDDFSIGQLVKFGVETGFEVLQITIDSYDVTKKYHFKKIGKIDSSGNIEIQNFNFGTFNSFGI